jgi:hypothetical protein
VAPAHARARLERRGSISRFPLTREPRGAVRRRIGSSRNERCRSTR